jgi:hypothetical protein
MTDGLDLGPLEPISVFRSRLVHAWWRIRYPRSAGPPLPGPEPWHLHESIDQPGDLDDDRPDADDE